MSKELLVVYASLVVLLYKVGDRLSPHLRSQMGIVDGGAEGIGKIGRPGAFQDLVHSSHVLLNRTEKRSGIFGHYGGGLEFLSFGQG